MTLEILTVPCLKDNYAYLMRDAATGKVGLVDAPEAGPIEAALAARGWQLDLILITHHHADHIEGVEALRDTYAPQVMGAAVDRHRLPPLDHAFADGETVELGNSQAQVIAVPGHTLGHVAFHFPDAGAVFTADSLMAMGCGRLFEGAAAQMWESLSTLAALPGATLVYSGHEYTESNIRFALTVDTDNPALVARAAEVKATRAKGQPTVPSRLDLEIATNPFLRARDPALKARLRMPNSTDAQVFAEIRRRKDAF